MNTLLVKQKIILLSLLPIGVLAVLGAWQIVSARHELQSAHHAEATLVYVRSAVQLHQELRKEIVYAISSIVHRDTKEQSMKQYAMQCISTDSALSKSMANARFLDTGSLSPKAKMVTHRLAELPAMMISLRQSVALAQQQALLDHVPQSYEQVSAVLQEAINTYAQINTEDPALATTLTTYMTITHQEDVWAMLRLLLVKVVSVDSAEGSDFKRYYELRAVESHYAHAMSMVGDADATEQYSNVVGAKGIAAVERYFTMILEQSDVGRFGIPPQDIVRAADERLVALQSIQKELANKAQASLMIVQKNKEQLLLIVAVSLICVVSLLSWLSMKIIRSITRPIGLLMQYITHVSEGNVSERFTDAETLQAQDEIAQLARAFSAMVEQIDGMIAVIRTEEEKSRKSVVQITALADSIRSQEEYARKSVEQILASMEEFAEGDLTVTLAVQSGDDIGRLFSGYNNVVATLREVIESMNFAFESTADMSHTVQAKTLELNKSASEQAEQILEIVSAVEEMSRTAQSNARQTIHVAEEARRVSNDAAQGGIVIEQGIEGMERIASTVLQLQGTIENLGKGSERIGEIVQSIYEIADQTNLLALNAAIEAARAGEAGRGFSVVADEVRKLSERTQKATKQIVETITKLQSETKTAVDVAREGMKESEQGRIAAAESRQALQRIVDHTSNVSDIITQISAASEEQSAVSNDIAGRMEFVSNATTEVSAGSSAIVRQMQDLDTMMSKLQRTMKHFRTA